MLYETDTSIKLTFKKREASIKRFFKEAFNNSNES